MVKRILVFVLSLVAGLIATVAMPASAAADDACVESVLTPSDQLIGNRIPVIGPYDVAVPAGDYRIVVTSSDLQHLEADPPFQPAETWFFATDSGYVSPVTPDLPDDEFSITIDLGVLTIPETSKITFFHAQEQPGAHSVTPSVSFLCPADGGPTSTTTPETTIPDTTVPDTTVPDTTLPETTVPETTSPETTVPASTAPETTVPATTAPETSAPATPPATSAPGVVSPTTVVAPTTTEAVGEVLPAPSIVRPPDDDAPATTAPGAVLPITVTPGTPADGDLARTGGSLVGVWVALLLIVAGGVSMAIGETVRRTNATAETSS